MSTFWTRWLKAWSLVLVAFGSIFTVIDFPLIGRPARLFYQLAFLPASVESPSITPALATANGVMGAVLMGWGLFLYLAVDPMIRDDAALLRRAIALALTVWYVFDTMTSWRCQAFGNVVANTIVYLVFMLPVLATSAKS